MGATCPSCRTPARGAAQYCAKCGQRLTGGAAAMPALTAPEGFARMGDGGDLYYRTEAAFGGSSLLKTEPLAVIVFNAGRTQRDAVVEIDFGDAGGERKRVEFFVEALPRGERVRIEVPSYELPDNPEEINVKLVSAQPSEC